MTEPDGPPGPGPSPEWVHLALESLRVAAWGGGESARGPGGLREALARLGVPREALRAYLALLDEKARAGVPSEGWSR